MFGSIPKRKMWDLEVVWFSATREELDDSAGN